MILQPAFALKHEEGEEAPTDIARVAERRAATGWDVVSAGGRARGGWS